MKNLIYLLVVISALFLTTACGSSDGQNLGDMEYLTRCHDSNLVGKKFVAFNGVIYFYNSCSYTYKKKIGGIDCIEAGDYWDLTKQSWSGKIKMEVVSTTCSDANIGQVDTFNYEIISKDQIDLY